MVFLLKIRFVNKISITDTTVWQDSNFG